MTRERKYKYCGVITDRSFKQALMEQYPNRKPGHQDAFKRKAEMDKFRDIPEFAAQSCVHEARRCQDVPLADLDQPRWAKSRIDAGMTVVGADKRGYFILRWI